MNNSIYPLQALFWECTLRCNAFCAFCGSRCGEVSSEELTTEEILTAFRDIANSFDPHSIMINVTGGEPLLRKDLFDVMSACTQLGFSWGMVTNGMLITPQIIEKMKTSGMKTISISLDGLQETHEAIRGVKNSFQTILNNIKLLRNSNFLDHLQVTTVVSKKNIYELDSLYELLKNLELDSWRVAIVDPIGRAYNNNELLLEKKELEYYLDFIHSHQDDSILPVISTCSHYLGGEDISLGRRPFACRAGKNLASILANGDIFVCPNVPRRPELIQGNIRYDSFFEVWNNKFQQFRNPSARKGCECAKCPDWTKCWGDSAHTWDYDNNEPLFCFRRFFPHNNKKTMLTLDSILEKIKNNVPLLNGINIHYGWKSTTPVVFTPNAAQELFHFFHWGKKHPQNLSELLGALIGHRLTDAFLVEFVSPAYLGKRNTKEAEFTQQSYESGIIETKAINATYSACDDLYLVNEPCVLLGFIHSHPDDLNLFLSESDVLLHKKLIKSNIELSMIVNPQKRQIAAYCGESMELAEIQILTEKEKVSEWNIQEC